MCVVGESAPEHILLEMRSDAVAHGHHAKRQVTASESLRHGADVRHNVAVLKGK